MSIDERIFDLDPHKLDEEWRKQPKAVFDFAKKLAAKERTLSRAKANTKLVQAELGLKIRAAPDDYGLGKSTEDSIKSAVLMQQEYKDAQEAEFQAEYDVGVLKGAMEALRNKKSELESAVYLYGQAYYAEPQHRSPEERERSQARESGRHMDEGVRKKKKER